MKVLSINTYGGSLLLGAKAVGADIIGSLEDSAFGLGIQQHNFPELEYVAYRKDWKPRDLSDTVVIAHPPCSAFSVQNCSPTARGVDSDAFACTKHVLDYAMENKALAVAVESVMGALGGAWHIHQSYADQFDYNLYRIVENGCMFGCQWRERFWILYVRKGVSTDNVKLTIKPQYLTVADVVGGHEGGDSAGNQDVLLERQKARLIEQAKLTPDEMSYLFEPQDPPHKTKALGTVLYEYKFKTPESTSMDKWDVFQKYIGGFASGTMVYLDPNGMAPVLMGGSHWYYNGRNLSENGFKRIMGFPAEYEFPSKPRNFKSQMRMYLSKGVMPPIAQWILEMTARHLKMTDGLNLFHEEGPDSYTLEAEPNHIADFRIAKQAWWERHLEKPPLRASEDIDKVKERKARVVGDRPVKIKTPRPPRMRDGEVVIHRGKLSDVRVTFVQHLLNPTSITDRKRAQILQIVNDLGQPTHHEAIAASLKHPDLQILPTTMHWHVRQLVKSGHLREVGGGPIGQGKEPLLGSEVLHGGPDGIQNAEAAI